MPPTLTATLAALIDPTGVEVGLAAEHLTTGQRIYHNAETLFPLASVVKVPLMVEVVRQIYTGQLHLETRLTLTEAHKTLPSGILLWMDPGLQPTIRDTLALMIMLSDNTATDMLFELVGGPSAVAHTMASLGFPDISVALTMAEMYRCGYRLPTEPPPTLADLFAQDARGHMGRDTVVHACTPQNNVSSAAAISRLMAAIGRGTLIHPEACQLMRTLLGLQPRGDAIPRLLPAGVHVMHKTGSIHRIRNDAAIIATPQGTHIALTILTRNYTPPEGTPTEEETRDTAVAALIARLARTIYDALADHPTPEALL